MAKQDPTDEMFFNMHRVVDAEGGAVRTYADTWCNHTAIAWALEALSGGQVLEVRFVIAQHHLKGNTVFRTFELHRDGDAIRESGLHPDGYVSSELTTLRRGMAYAAAELAYVLEANAHRLGGMIFRQPEKKATPTLAIV